MPISGVLLTCREEALETVRNSVSRRPRVDVQAASGPMLVVVTDTATLEEDRQMVNWLAALPGVLSAFVAFSNIEDLDENAAAGAKQ